MVFEESRRIQAITVARARATSTTCALQGGGLCYPGDLKGLNAVGDVITSLPKINKKR